MKYATGARACAATLCGLAVAVLAPLGCISLGDDFQPDFEWDAGFDSPPLPSGTLGELGRARFLVSAREKAPFQTTLVPVSKPLMRSMFGTATITFEVEPETQWGQVYLMTTDTTILSVTPFSSPEAWLRAKEVGEARLELVAEDGMLLDWIPVEVAPLDTLELSLVEDGGSTALAQGSTLALAVGEVRRIDTRALDAQGRELIVSDSIGWSVPDTAICGIRPIWYHEELAEVPEAEIIDVTGIAPGTTTLTISADQLEIEVPIVVSDAGG